MLEAPSISSRDIPLINWPRSPRAVTDIAQTQSANRLKFCRRLADAKEASDSHGGDRVRVCHPSLSGASWGRLMLHFEYWRRNAAGADRDP
jgi:hypothetical protein